MDMSLKKKNVGTTTPEKAVSIGGVKSEEMNELRKLGARVFFGWLGAMFWSFMFSKPESALVARSDDRIVSGFCYKIMKIGSKKIGYVTYFFTDPAYHGRGIGSRLCGEGLAQMRKDCDMLITFVRDDNAASWKNFEKRGFQRVPFMQMAHFFGVFGAIRLYFSTMFSMTVGYDFYVSSEEKLVVKENSEAQILVFLALNILLISLVSLDWLAAWALILVGWVAVGYVATLFTKRKWRFRTTNGGLLISGLIATFVNGIYPISGNWYPETYEKSWSFKRDLGVNSLAVWVFLLAVNLISQDWHAVQTLTSALLVFKCLPLDVFKTYGSERVYSWNRGIYILMVVLTIGAIMWGNMLWSDYGISFRFSV